MSTQQVDGWISPRLGVRFDLSRGELQVLRPMAGRWSPTWRWRHKPSRNGSVPSTNGSVTNA